MRGQVDRLALDVETLQARLWALSARVDGERRGAAAPTQATATATAEPPGAAPTPAPPAPVPPPPIVPPPIPAFAREDADELRRGKPAAPVAPVAPVAPALESPAAPVAPATPALPVWDWESLLGVRGAAWLGGITLVIAALFFARWSIEQGFFTPVIRIAIMLLAGTGALLWAELKLREGYQTTANALSGAGVVGP